MGRPRTAPLISREPLGRDEWERVCRFLWLARICATRMGRGRECHLEAFQDAATDGLIRAAGLTAIWTTASSAVPRGES
jgi:hypothetical protein